MREFFVLLLLFGSMIVRASANDGASVKPREEKLYAIVYTEGPTWQHDKPMEKQNIAPHGKYMKSLFDTGVIQSAGPFGPTGGLVLFYAVSQADADAVMANDPAVKTGLFKGTVKRYSPRFLQAGAAADKR